MKTTALKALLLALAAVGCYCAGHVHGTRDAFQHVGEIFDGFHVTDPDGRDYLIHAIDPGL